MSDKDMQKLMEIAQSNHETAKLMTRKDAIISLNEAGILTKKGKFKKAYSQLQQLINH